MTTPIYGVTPQGFNAMRLPEIKDELEDLFIAEFGDINLDAQSVTGQIIGIFSKVLADDWENLSDVYLSQYPNSASGISLDNVVQLNGLTRLPALRTSVIGSATGTQGTLIPAGSLARLEDSPEIFFSTENAFITNGSALQNVVNVTSATSQQYTVLLSGTQFVYSIPAIMFSGPIVPGNIISARINGVNVPNVPYNTSDAQTLIDLANVIMANFAGSVFSATPIANGVRLVPVLGRQIIVTAPFVSGGGAPTASVAFSPTSANTVAEYLSSNINTNSTIASSSWTGGSSFTISARNSSLPYAITVGSNLQITSTSSPIPFLAQNFGPISAPANSLTEILTPVAGWVSLTNPQAGITGRNQETDAELRLRREQSLHLLGAATVEAIRSRLLQEVDGVTSVTVFENVTLTQDPFTVVFSTDFIAGNASQINLDAVNIGTATYVSSSLQVMNDMADILLAQPEIKSVIVGGTGNRELEITMNDAEEIELEFNISGAGAPTYALAGGRPPKSFEAVVEGGLDSAIALKIWQLKPAGIQTFGNTHIIITDSQGNPQGINFTRATPVYIWVLVTLTLNPQETFPVNGQELVSEAIMGYGNSLGIGIDVIIQRVQAVCFAVPGIASATVQLARTINLSTAPSYVSTDVSIGETEISVWDLSRINVSV